MLSTAIRCPCWQAIEQFLELPPHFDATNHDEARINASGRRNPLLLNRILTNQRVLESVYSVLPRSAIRLLRSGFERLSVRSRGSLEPNRLQVSEDEHRFVSSYLAEDTAFYEGSLLRRSYFAQQRAHAVANSRDCRDRGPSAVTHAATPTPRARIVHGKSLLLAGKLALAAGLIYWLIHTGRFDLSLFAAFFSPSGLWGLGAIFVLQLTAFTFVVARWAVLVRAQSIPLPFAEVLRTGYQGLASSLILPGSLGLDGIRFLHIRNRYREHMVAGAASILMDRLTGFVGLLVLGIGASALYWASSGNPQLNTLLALNVVLLLAALFLISFVCIVLSAQQPHVDSQNALPHGNAGRVASSSTQDGAAVSIASEAASHLFTCAPGSPMRLVGVDPGPGIIAVAAL